MDKHSTAPPSILPSDDDFLRIIVPIIDDEERRRKGEKTYNKNSHTKKKDEEKMDYDFTFHVNLTVDANKRLVITSAYHYDQTNKKGSINYCDLEIFQNGNRILEHEADSIIELDNTLKRADNWVAVHQLIPLSSGEFTALIIKDRLDRISLIIFVQKIIF